MTLKETYDAEMKLTQGNLEASQSAKDVGDAFSDYTSDIIQM